MLIQGVLTKNPLFLYHLQMLETLDNIDWSKIHHAYGPATGVPVQIRALAFGDERQRKSALYELHGNIWHQHTIYEATSFAVPFLVEIVQNRIAEEEILSLIALIAAGTSYFEMHGGLLRDRTSEDERNMQSEQHWVKAAKRAVAGNAKFFYTLVTSANKKIRELSIFILGVIESESEITAVDVIEQICRIE